MGSESKSSHVLKNITASISCKTMEITKQLQMQLLKDTETALDDTDENKKDSRKYRMEP